MLRMRWTKLYLVAWSVQVCHSISGTASICCWLCASIIYSYVLLLFFVDEDMDELEEELKSLLNESKPVSVSGLPEVPANRLRPYGESSLTGDDLLSSLPPAPHSNFHLTTEQLEEELHHLTLTNSGLHFDISLLFCLYWTLTCSKLTHVHLFVQAFNRKKWCRQPRDLSLHSDDVASLRFCTSISTLSEPL